ncbi:MAG TPA: hypothetical protein VFF11_14105 [Candidatus Binatia bacterium]|nr:hypothetical protein [Candidatus Binatia bacterium]
MKLVNLNIEKLEERIAPGGLTTVGVPTIGVGLPTLTGGSGGCDCGCGTNGSGSGSHGTGSEGSKGSK